MVDTEVKEEKKALLQKNKIILSSDIILNVRINTESMNWQDKKNQNQTHTKPNALTTVE